MEVLGFSALFSCREAAGVAVSCSQEKESLGQQEPGHHSCCTIPSDVFPGRPLSSVVLYIPTSLPLPGL